MVLDTPAFVKHCDSTSLANVFEAPLSEVVVGDLLRFRRYGPRGPLENYRVLHIEPSKHWPEGRRLELARQGKHIFTTLPSTQVVRIKRGGGR